MMNLQKLKWAGSYALVGLVPTVFFFAFLVMKNFWWGLGGLFLSFIPAKILAYKIIKHPFTEMLQGQGMIAFTLDSSGVMVPFIVKQNLGKIYSLFENIEKTSVFNRKNVAYLSPPREGDLVVGLYEDKKGKVVGKDIFIKIPKKMYEYSFRFDQYPVLLFDKNSKRWLPKDFFQEKEMEYKKNMMLELEQKLEDVGRNIRDFARYIIEKSRPTKSHTLAKRLLIVFLVVLVLGGIIYLFMSQGANGGNLVQTGQQALQNNLVSPK